MSIHLNMIFNLAQYLKDEFPAEIVFAEERFPISGYVPERNILVRDTGGLEREVIEDNTYQIICRDKNFLDAKFLSRQVYEKIQGTAKTNGRFGLILPAAVVNGVNIDQVQVARIIAIQRPESFGKDENGLSEFSMNFQIFI